MTDGTNDGGIDFIYFDEEDSKLFLCQSKYTSTMRYGDKNEFDKICDTINDFRRSNTGHYNEKPKRILQNALDRLPDDDRDNIEIALFIATDKGIDVEETIKHLYNDITELDRFTVSIYLEEDIEKKNTGASL